MSYNHILWLDTKLALPTKGAVQPAHYSPPVSQHRLNQIKEQIWVQFDLVIHTHRDTTSFNLHLLLIWLASHPHKNLVIMRENKEIKEEYEEIKKNSGWLVLVPVI